MPLQVTLASGKEVEVVTQPGAAVPDLRKEIGEKLDLHPASIEISADGKALEDKDVVPDSVVTVILVRLPWVGAPEDRVKDLGGGEFEVVGEAEKGSSKINALCGVGFADGIEYFEIEVMEGSGAFIGVSTKDGLAPGYKVKGLLYGGPGNLSNGSGGLRTGFGDGVKKGSIIGVTLDLTDEAAVGLTFWDGDKCLGEAFKGCERSPGAIVYPVVSANKTGDRFKLSLRRLPRVQDTSQPPHSAHGSWDLQRFRVGTGADYNLAAALGVKGKGGGKGGAGHIVMKLAQLPSDPQAFKLSLALGNTLMTSVRLVVGDDGSEALQLGPVAGTMVMAPPELMDLEQQFSQALPQVLSWTIAGAGTDAATLQLRGPDVEIDFLHYDAPPVEPISNVTLP
eukprot:CAMPEP_0178437728 /NCGR_PEP_ID=MMETSP0689_2-20121128/35167_1 /TAXON_ID=160604 /ORGANISM="Amphidinium massartii, Strain CS-259" /LENGTH=394 /DNA_ID=CAMNT_0020059989 /DNA_START=88 /DNA_END=1272 /DNA_ORIENTATION=-